MHPDYLVVHHIVGKQSASPCPFSIGAIYGSDHNFIVIDVLYINDCIASIIDLGLDYAIMMDNVK